MEMYTFIHISEAYAVRLPLIKVSQPLLQSRKKPKDSLFFKPPQGVAGAIVRGVGKQKVGAICNFVSFYVIGFPVGVSLMFPLKMGVVGEATLILDRIDVKSGYCWLDSCFVLPRLLQDCGWASWFHFWPSLCFSPSTCTDWTGKKPVRRWGTHPKTHVCQLTG